MNPDWKPVAHRGQLTMIAITLGRAKALGIPFRAEAALVGELRPDEGRPIHVSYVSVESMRAFIDEMQPRFVLVEVAPGEDRQELQKRLLWPSGLH
jgi:hypothetical protein